jgi:ABC-type sugar transport system ATPase subunit
VATLKLEGIVKSFGAVPVVRGIDLDIGAGEFTGLRAAASPRCCA